MNCYKPQAINILVFLSILLIRGMVTSADMPNRMTIPCFVQAVTESSAVVRWNLERPAKSTFIYGRSTDYSDTIVLDTASLVFARLSSLIPSTKYYYNIIMDGQLVFSDRESYFLLTAPQDIRQSIVFAVIGDTRGGENSFESDHRSVIESIRKYSFPRMLLHTGDLVDKADELGWISFFDAEHSLLRQCPIFPVRGNSDWAADNFRKMFVFHSGEENDSLLYYAFQFGSVYFINLDINYRRSNSYYQKIIGIDSKQYIWLEKQLRSQERNACPFTVISFYSPVFIPPAGDKYLLRKILCPLFERYGVDIVLNGGFHGFLYAANNGVRYFISGGGGAVLENVRKPLTKEIKFAYSAFHHLRVSVNYAVMTIDAVDCSGTVFFSQSLESDLFKNTGYPLDNTVISHVTSGDTITIFGSTDCYDCNHLKADIIPELLSELKIDDIFVRFIDIDDKDNFAIYSEIESALNQTKHSFPVILIGNNLLSGSQLNPDTLSARITRIHPDKKYSIRVSRHLLNISLFLFPIFIVIAVILYAIIKRKRKFL